MFGQRLAAAAIISVCTLACHAGVPTKMSESGTQTYCVGRFVVDVPQDAKVHGEVNDYVFGAVEAQRVHMDEPAFRDFIKHREADLPKTLGSSDYKLAKSISAGPRAQIITGSMDLYGNATYGFDAAKLDDSGVLFNLHADPYEPKAFESIIPDVRKILDRLHGRTENTIPHQPGFCIRDGFIADDGKGDQYEDASISFQFAQWPGVLVTVRTMTVIKPGEPTLLQRVDKDPVPDALKNLVSQVRTLRKGKHDVNGRHGEELVASFPTHSSYRLYKFRWESQGDLKTPLKPTVIVELESGAKSEDGEPVNPRLSEGDAVALFDTVLNSVRLRPTSANAAVSESDPHPNEPHDPSAQQHHIA